MVLRAFGVLAISAWLSTLLTGCIFPLPGMRAGEGSVEPRAKLPTTPTLDSLPNTDESSSSFLSLYECVARGQDLDDSSGECVAVAYDPSSAVGSWQSACRCGRMSAAAMAALADSTEIKAAPKIAWRCWQERLELAETSYRRSIDLFDGARCGGRKLASVAQEGRYESGSAAADPALDDEANRSGGRRGLFINFEHGAIHVTLLDAETTKAWSEKTACGIADWPVNEAQLVAQDACRIDLPPFAFTSSQSLALTHERSSFRRYAARLRVATAPLLRQGADSSARNVDVDMGEDFDLVPAR